MAIPGAPVKRSQELLHFILTTFGGRKQAFTLVLRFCVAYAVGKRISEGFRWFCLAEAVGQTHPWCNSTDWYLQLPVLNVISTKHLHQINMNILLFFIIFHLRRSKRLANLTEFSLAASLSGRYVLFP